MMTSKNSVPLDEVLYAFAVENEVPDAETLDKFVQQYPQYAEALTEFAVELVLDITRKDTEIAKADAGDDTVSPAVSRAISYFQNCVYELSKITPVQNAGTVVNPIAALDQTGFRALASAIHANNTFMIKLRDRLIEPETIVNRNGFCRAIADELNMPMEAMIGHFKAAPVIAAGQHYKSDGKPAATKRETFEEAVRRSGLTEEQQRYILNL